MVTAFKPYSQSGSYYNPFGRACPAHRGARRACHWLLRSALPRTLWHNSVAMSSTSYTRRSTHGPTYHTAATPTASSASDPGNGSLGLLRRHPHLAAHRPLRRYRRAGDADPPGWGRTGPADG